MAETLKRPDCRLQFREQADAIVTLPSSHHVSEECRSLSGIRLNAPMRGINIIRSADGKTRKVFVR